MLMNLLRRQTQSTSNPDPILTLIHTSLNSYDKEPVNCSIDYVIGYSDAHCNEICSDSGAAYDGSMYFLKAGVCVQKDIAGIKLDECNLSAGFLTMFSYNKFFKGVEYYCSSIDPGITGKSSSDSNKICMNGSLSEAIDYRRQLPSLNSCQCDHETQVLLITNNSYNVRANGICVPNVYKRMINDLSLGKENIVY